MLKSVPVRLFHAHYKEAISLLKTAFPKEEMMPVGMLKRIAHRRYVSFMAYEDDGKFVGLSYAWSSDHEVFVLYLAVNPKIRSKGYGSRILQQIQKDHPGKEITLNIEPVVDTAANYQQRLKRLKFYEKNGFHETGYVLGEDGDEYSILSTGSHFSIEEYRRTIGLVRFGSTMPETRKIA
ncbi:MAG: GNAT family N-acetyltransferase [Lactimicrobium sp.]|jgi:GNAT superfamily N-acetyltransferase|uniref:GNAT family N-acetyltransferase n=1 Tax=Lactimicrobium sp. TaxID=2563780 RepID=UPI002F360934